MEQFKITDLEAVKLKYHAERVRAQQLAVKLAQVELALLMKEQQAEIDAVVAAYQPEGTKVIKLDPGTATGMRDVKE
jgi:hypothetical protein